MLVVLGLGDTYMTAVECGSGSGIVLLGCTVLFHCLAIAGTLTYARAEISAFPRRAWRPAFPLLVGGIAALIGLDAFDRSASADETGFGLIFWFVLLSPALVATFRLGFCEPGRAQASPGQPAEGEHHERYTVGTWACLLAGVFGLTVYLGWETEVFPASQMRLDLTRERARGIALEFLDRAGCDTEGYEVAASFGVSDLHAEVFLQRAVGLDGAMALLRDELSVFHWVFLCHRFGSGLAYVCHVGPGGRVARFERIVDPDEIAETVPTEGAEVLASDFLSSVVQLELSRFRRAEPVGMSTLVQRSQRDSRSVKHPHHRFEWEQPDKAIPWRGAGEEASNCKMGIAVEIHGRQVVFFDRFVRVPVALAEEYETHIDRTVVLLLLKVLLVVAVAVAFASEYRAGRIWWRLAMAASLCAAVLGLVSFLNTMAAETDAHDPLMSSFMMQAMRVGFMVAIPAAALIFLVGASVALGQHACPGAMGFLQQVARGRLQLRSLQYAVLNGYALGFLLAGYYTLGNLAGQRWLDTAHFLPPLEFLSATVPWLEALRQALSEALFGELTYRLLLVAGLTRILRHPPIAVLLSAVLYATASPLPGYPQGFQLGVEIIAGAILGWFLIRKGVIACMVASLTVSLLSTGVPLLHAEHPDFVSSGIAICLLAATPLVTAVPALRRRDGVIRVGLLRDTHVDRAREVELGIQQRVQQIEAEYREQQDRQSRQITQLEDELRTAHEMQMGLMPAESPAVPGFSLAGRCMPASQVGGDFYQYYPSSESLIVCLADVTGHAMAAAIPAVMFSGILATQIEANDPLDELITQLNRTLARVLDRRTFVCVSMAQLDLASREVGVANAGCPYPYHYDAFRGEVREVQAEAYPLGVKPETQFRLTRIRLEAGDRLVLCSDGIVEAANPEGEVFGFDRTAETIERGCSRGMGAIELLEHLTAAVREFAAGGPQEDDQTVVVLAASEAQLIPGDSTRNG